MSGSRIIGWGSNLPEKKLTNHDLSSMMDTRDEWIVERTGISSRHVGGSTGTMSIHAGQQALDRAGLTGDDIDLVIVATSTPDQLMPGTSATVHAELGIRGGACDMQAVCSGFTYGLTAANGLINTGLDRILVIGLTHPIEASVNEATAQERTAEFGNPMYLFGKVLNSLMLSPIEML